jgi:two-component system nitrogen regulation response regulator GlnG
MGEMRYTRLQRFSLPQNETDGIEMQSLPNLLIVDDDILILECFRYAFAEQAFSLSTATTAKEAIERFRQGSFDVVITDIRLPDSTGLKLLQDLHALDPKIPVILMTGQGTADTAIEAMRKGAFEYLLKPLQVDEVQMVVERALVSSRMSKTSATIAADPLTNDGDQLVGQCPAMQEVYRQIGRVAGQSVTVLILGESGTGKEVVARAIYQYSKRAEQPFLAINCAAIPENLLESELFGHERGSFTGAERKRIGKFEQCHGGTLFLDEIGDMTPLTQTKVLRVLQDQQFERVGGQEKVCTDVRLIAATNRNLAEMMEHQTFRSDLYYRLNVYTIHLPPLRERNGDLPLLIEYFLRRFSKELGKTVQEVSADAMQRLAEYSWPGNLRELQSVLKHAVIEATGPVLLSEFLPKTFPGRSDSLLPRPAANTTDMDQLENSLLRFIHQQISQKTETLYDDVIQQIERILLVESLHHVDGNISRAATLLGISRSTLRVKLAALGILLDRSVRMNE